MLNDLASEDGWILETISCGVKFLGDIVLGKCDRDQMKSPIFGSGTNKTGKSVITENW